MSSEPLYQNNAAAIEALIHIPELRGLTPFKVSYISVDGTFAALYEKCINDPRVLAFEAQSGHRLDMSVSRHFWDADQMLLRSARVGSLTIARNAGTQNVCADLTLHPDFYLVQPSHLIHDAREQRAIDPEGTVADALAMILRKTQDGKDQTRCYRLCNHRGKPLPPMSSLVEAKLWPLKWTPDLSSSRDAMPPGSRLTIKPRFPGFRVC